MNNSIESWGSPISQSKEIETLNGSDSLLATTKEVLEITHSMDFQNFSSSTDLPDSPSMVEEGIVVGVSYSEPSHDTTFTTPTISDDLLVHELKSIPDKMGFKIGDVADLVGLKQYVLRYWESEFDILKPKKATNKQRYYTKRDVENVFIIRKLLHRDRYSIEGARSALKLYKKQIKNEFQKREPQIDLTLEKENLEIVNKMLETRLLNAQTRLIKLIEDIREIKSTFQTPFLVKDL